jgi:hypothetical protein
VHTGVACDRDLNRAANRVEMLASVTTIFTCFSALEAVLHSGRSVDTNAVVSAVVEEPPTEVRLAELVQKGRDIVTMQATLAGHQVVLPRTLQGDQATEKITRLRQAADERAGLTPPATVGARVWGIVSSGFGAVFGSSSAINDKEELLKAGAHCSHSVAVVG